MARQLMQPSHLPLNRLTPQQSQQLAASYQQAQRPQQALHPSLMGYPPAAAMQVGRRAWLWGKWCAYLWCAGLGARGVWDISCYERYFTAWLL